MATVKFLIGVFDFHFLQCAAELPGAKVDVVLVAPTAIYINAL